MAVAKDSKSVYVADNQDNRLYVIDADPASPTFTRSSGHRRCSRRCLTADTQSVAVNPATGEILVTSRGANMIAVLDPSSFARYAHRVRQRHRSAGHRRLHERRGVVHDPRHAQRRLGRHVDKDPGAGGHGNVDRPDDSCRGHIPLRRRHRPGHDPLHAGRAGPRVRDRQPGRDVGDDHVRRGRRRRFRRAVDTRYPPCRPPSP